MGKNEDGGVDVGVDGAGAEELVVDLEGELGARVGGGCLEEGEGRLEMGVAAETSDAKLLVCCSGVVEGGATAAAETSLCTTDGLVVLEVAVCEGVDEGRVRAKARSGKGRGI